MTVASTVGDARDLAGLVLLAMVPVLGGWTWWQLSVPSRATRALVKLTGVKDDRPRLRWAWKSGCVWKLAWMMPVGATVAKVDREGLEQALDCGARVWYNRGLLWAELGTARLPDSVSYRTFARTARRRRVARMALPIPLGRSRLGAFWVDLATLPHLLVGGTTNYGKSGFLREVLVTLVTRFDPDDLYLALADLKSGVEFGVFEELPHLRIPVMTTLAACIAGFESVSGEVDRRLALLRSERVENIGRYNRGRTSGRLPYLVVVVDEVGELRPADTTDKEERGERQRAISLLIRIGRLGRAAGVHLICATQRPDAETVGGQLKAQLPATIAFYVRDAVQSRILLDDRAAADLPALPGRAVWQHGADQVQLQVPYLDLEEATAMIAGVGVAWQAVEAADHAIVEAVGS